MGKELQSSFSPRDGAPGSKWSSYMPCRELSEELALAAHRSPDRGLAWSEPKAQNMGPNGTFKTPEDNQSNIFEPGHENKGSFFEEFARRGRVALAAFAVAVGGILGVGHAAEAVNEANTTTTCQEFEMHGAKPLPDGTVEASSADRGAIQAFLNENANGLSVDYLKVGTPQEPGSEYSGMFRKDTVAEVCVTRNPISGNIDVDTDTKISPSNPSF